MVINPIHRALTQEYPVEVYKRLADDCVARIRGVPGVLSVAIFGSLAKDDIVPGWSDLDLLVFVSQGVPVLDTLSQLRLAIADAREEIAIGVGVDVVESEQFMRSHRLGGRPIYVSYDVAAYCHIHHGPNFFSCLPLVESKSSLIEMERPIALSAEIHNWKSVFMSNQVREGAAWPARCIKTLLKLLQYKTGPLLEPPFTYDGSLAKLRRLEANHPLIADFCFAVEARHQWPLLAKEPEALSAATQRSMTAIAGYAALAPRDLI